ncbi:MAG: hypothetical protein ACREDL_25180, partial [Bradyrhizobium sp.]
GRAHLRACVAVLLLAAASSLGGCASSGATSGAYAKASTGPAIAFESIDGPPPEVFDRMVGVLDSESKLRNLTIVSRKSPAASYRVRSYLAAQVVHGHTMISWVWDVYDEGQQRALRLSGEEDTSKSGRDPWGAADDLVLRKIAQAGFSGLSGMVNGNPPATPASPAAPAPAPVRREPVVASAEPGPGATGGYRVSALSYASRQPNFR